MLEQLLDIRNFENACKQNNVRVGGSSGMDGMQTDALRDLQNVRWQALRKDIIDGRYKTQPAKKVEIPQLERAILMLSISPVIDGVIQESLLQ